MKKAYFETIFLLKPRLESLPAEFCIITACNPMDRILSEDENLTRNKQLHSMIERSGNECLEIIGMSPDRAHQEPSFITSANFDDCLKWAKLFDQRAIFAVVIDQLEIISCSPPHTKYPSGLFSERLIS